MIDIIVACHDRKDLTAVTLSMLRECLHLKTTTVKTINDCSTEYTSLWLAEVSGGDLIWYNTASLGVGGVARQRLEWFLSGDAEYLLALDNDMLVVPGIDHRCLSLYQDARKITALPLVLTPYRSTCHTETKWVMREGPPYVTLYECLETIGGAAMFMDREAAQFLLDYVPAEKWDKDWDWAVCASGVMMVAPPESWCEHLGRFGGGVNGVSVDKARNFVGYRRTGEPPAKS